MKTHLNTPQNLQSALDVLLIKYDNAPLGSKEKSMLQQSILLLRDALNQDDSRKYLPSLNKYKVKKGWSAFSSSKTSH
ncbi:hypothetical protein HH214_09765 [Mucilaginibacter robiniae]|uniref:Uncharacterized protein n=1 Tax=Mucilaginibacter robiniae TaxID=2728022 RepID=A0A7L5E0V1_9SPHI|nr:hypothetical protein [Mucilaginibacter robiniae]QJD96138.1 hypothetical protein HH214_09765 [Mucilaginibacter robiniae]